MTPIEPATDFHLHHSPGVITLDQLNAVPPQITSLTRLGNGALQFLGTGPRGAAHRILIHTLLGFHAPSSGTAKISQRHPR